MAVAKNFSPASAYRTLGGGYALLPFRFLRWDRSEVLMVNEVGEYIFVSNDAFREFTEKRLDVDSELFHRLESRSFLAPIGSTTALDLLAVKLRTKKAFLNGFTRLHIFVVTLRCDTSCRYCQVSRVNAAASRFDMSEETARRAIDLMFCSPAEELKVEIQGGEPLLNLDRLEQILETTESHPQRAGRRIHYVLATHLGELSRRAVDLLKAYSVRISTSLDGPRDLHEANRPKPGAGSYLPFVENLQFARAELGYDSVSALMTTTERSLDRAEDIVDEYVSRGFREIFLRSISPYGIAVRTGESRRYGALRFLDFYRRAFERILYWNRQGVALTEFYARILLAKILTPFATGYVDLQSPTGLGIGVAVYNYDGDVYAADEARMLAEMGDRSFRLGNVHRDSYEEIFAGETLRQLVYNSVQEAWPGCHECAFLPYCGTDVIFNYKSQVDIVGHRPTSEFCSKNMGILKYLFSKLREGDDFTRDLLISWACAN